MNEMRAEEALVQAFSQGRMEMIDTILHNIGNAINSVATGIDTLNHHLVDDPLLPRFKDLADAVSAHQEDWVDYVAHDPQGQKVMPFVIALAENLARQRDAMIKTVARVRERTNHIVEIVRTQEALGSPHMERKDVDLENALSAAARFLSDSLNKRRIRVEIHCEGRAAGNSRSGESISSDDGEYHQEFDGSH